MKRLNLSFQKIRVDDLDEIYTIASETRHSNWTKNDYEDEIGRPDNLALLVKSNQKTIGFIIARLIILSEIIDLVASPEKDLKKNSGKDTENPVKSAAENYNRRTSEVEIYNIAVSEAFQRQGIGDILLKKFYEEAGKLLKFHKMTIWLEVRNSNTDAINFYLSRNFERLYERKNYYSRPTENAFVMKREITRR